LTGDSGTPLFLSAQLLAAELGLAKVDLAAVRSRFMDTRQPDAIRLQVLDALIAFHDPGLLAVLPDVFASNPARFVQRVFAALGRVEDPKLAEVLVAEYARLAPELQPLAIDLIMQRETW